MLPRLLLLLTAWVLPGAHAASQQNPASGFIIAGTVEQHGTNQPLKRVEVSISPVEHRDQTLSCITTSDGRFKFTKLPQGKYSLTAQMHGLVQGYRGDGAYSTAIVVGSGIDSEHITFVFDVPLTISGTIVDEEGEPVRNAQVFLFHRGIFSGTPQIRMQAQAGTGASGDFHFGSLKRGTYFVAVSARPWYAQDTLQNSNSAEFDVAYPITYYPEALDLEGASPITLSEGGSANLQMSLRPVPALRLKLPVKEPLSFQISTAGPGGVSVPVNTSEMGESDEREIVGVPPGHYLLTVQRFGQGSSPTVASKALELAANSTLDISDIRPTSISGQLQIEGGQLAVGGLALALVKNNLQTATALVTADGSFRVSNGSISPGKYQLQLANTRDLYIKSITATGAEYSHGILDIPEGASIQLSIVAAKGLSDVNGIAIKNDKPFAGAMVLLLPQDPSRGISIPRDQSDSDGTFTLNSVPPGRYTLIAIEDGRDLAYAVPSVIKPYLAQGQSIDIPLANAATGVKVNVQPRLR